MYTTTVIVTARYTITMPDARELFDKARELAEEDHYQEAIALLDPGIRIDANNAIAWYNKGFILFKMGRFQDALLAFAQATDIDPDFDQACTTRGWHCCGSGNILKPSVRLTRP